MQKPYQPELDILKAAAILAVVGIHVISSLSLHPNTQGLAHWLLLILDQWARFSVPLFVALSGYGLGLKYTGRAIKPLDYLKRRFKKLIPLYLLWSLVIYTVVHLYTNWGDFVSSYSLLEAVLLGRADYQLYFIPMIFQLYLIFPLIWKAITPHRANVVVVAVAFGLQLAGFKFMQTLGWSDQAQYTLFISWIGYFVLGGALSQVNLPAYLRTKKVGVPLALTVVTTVVWAIYNAHVLETTGANIIDATRFTRFPVLVYAATAVFVSLAFKSWLKHIPPRLTRRLAFIGRHSYLIFLSHTLLLRILIELSHQNLDFPAWATGTTAFLVAIHLSPKISG